MSTVGDSFSPEYLDFFWQFVFERQSIWQRRVAQGLPPPWTSDPTLQHERFTNIYRELDPGTQYVVEQVLELNAPRPDKLFNVMLYRLLGRSSTHAALGFQTLATFDANMMQDVLKDLRRKGAPPFTAAYMVSAYSAMGSSDKIENIARLFEMLHADFDAYFGRVLRSRTAAEAHAALKTAYGFGNFLSYQILVDLLYPLRIYGGVGILPFSNEDWASAGPGAQQGIRMLMRPGVKPSFLQVMRWLRDNQHAEFSRLYLDFPYLEDPEGTPIPISLANIQNCLCEFHKYVKIRERTGRGRRKFVATTESKSAVQLDFAIESKLRSP